jgi:chorismate mutase
MTLEALRAEITRTDKEIIRLIAHRQDLAGRIAKIKIHEGRPVHDEQRTAEVLKTIFDQAVEAKVDPVAVQKIFEQLIAMSEERQRECFGDGNLP